MNEDNRPDDTENESEKFLYAVGDVYYAKVRFKDLEGNYRPQGAKWRPIVALYDFNENEVAFYMITSTTTGYLSERFGCQIQDLESAGLTKPSMVRLGVGFRYGLDEPDPIGNRKGALSTKDMVRIIDAYERISRQERIRTQEQIENAKSNDNQQEKNFRKNDFEQER